MPTKIELLRQAGFSTEQIVDWAYKERLRMRADGRDDADIDREFGVTRPADADQAPFLQRLKNGLVLQHMIDAAKDHWNQSVGEHPLDSALDNWGFLSRFGPAGQAATTAVTDLELASKGASGVLGGLGAAAGQGLEEAFGPGNRPKGTAARDAALMAEMVPIFSAAMAPARAASIVAPLRTAGTKFSETFPKAKEFQTAAASISGNSKNSGMEQQLLQLWREFGVHPLDVASEVSRNPTIAEAIKSNSAGLGSRTATAESGNARFPATPVATGEAGQSPQLGTGGRTEITKASEAGSDAGGSLDRARAPHIESSGESIGRSAHPADDRNGDLETAEVAPSAAHNAMVDMMDAPSLEQRPFNLDYPTKPQRDGSLLLPTDIEGRELHARFIAGRRTWGGTDQGLTSKEINQIIRDLAIRVKTMPLPDGIAGQYFRYGNLDDYRLQHFHLSPELTARERELTKAHELGHALDDFLGWASLKLAPDSKEMDQLRMVYGRARKGDPSVWFTRQPEHYRYTQAEVPKELMADGLRVYLRNPNFFKRVAPDAARMIRALVNEHPVLSKVIQFNSLAGAGILATRPHDDDDVASDSWQ